jgi:hypothetical protein
MTAVQEHKSIGGARVDASPPAPESLTWKVGRFRVRIVQEGREELHDITVRGVASGVFGVFRGSGHGPAPEDRHIFSLVHLPTGRIMVTLRNRRECMTMAAELLPLRVPWNETGPEKVVEGAPDQPQAMEIYARYMGWRKG